MPTGDPQLEPIFEEIETPTHGRVKACENLYPKQLEAEMAATLAQNHPRIVITPESDPAVIQEQLKSLAGGEDRVVLFTVTTNEHMQIVPKKFGEGELRQECPARLLPSALPMIY